MTGTFGTAGAVRYAHVNIVARDWRSLAAFYQRVFGCEPVPPARDHHGPWLEKVTNLPGASLKGMHLHVPGYGDKGPTLEIFEYVPPYTAREAEGTDQPGFAHIAFVVADVHAAREAVLAGGGQDLGEIVTHTIPGAGTIELVYMRDPEGNIIELQRWLEDNHGA